MKIIGKQRCQTIGTSPSGLITQGRRQTIMQGRRKTITSADFFRRLRLSLRVSGLDPVTAAVAAYVEGNLIPWHESRGDDAAASYWREQLGEIRGSGMFDALAIQQARRVINPRVPGATTVEDELQNLALWVFEGIGGGIGNLNSRVRSLSDLKGYLTKAFRNFLIDRMRYLSRHETSGVSTVKGDEGEELDIFETLEAPQWGNQAMAGLRRALDRHVKRKSTSEQWELYELYMELVEGRDPGQVKFTRDVWPVLAVAAGEPSPGNVRELERDIRGLADLVVGLGGRPSKSELARLSDVRSFGKEWRMKPDRVAELLAGWAARDGRESELVESLSERLLLASQVRWAKRWEKVRLYIVEFFKEARGMDFSDKVVDMLVPKEYRYRVRASVRTAEGVSARVAASVFARWVGCLMLELR